VISLKFSSEFRPGPRFSVNRAIRVNLAENLDGIRWRLTSSFREESTVFDRRQTPTRLSLSAVAHPAVPHTSVSNAGRTRRVLLRRKMSTESPYDGRRQSSGENLYYSANDDIIDEEEDENDDEFGDDISESLEYMAPLHGVNLMSPRSGGPGNLSVLSSDDSDFAGVSPGSRFGGGTSAYFKQADSHSSNNQREDYFNRNFGDKTPMATNRSFLLEGGKQLFQYKDSMDADDNPDDMSQTKEAGKDDARMFPSQLPIYRDASDDEGDTTMEDEEGSESLGDQESPPSPYQKVPSAASTLTNSIPSPRRSRQSTSTDDSDASRSPATPRLSQQQEFQRQQLNHLMMTPAGLRMSENSTEIEPEKQNLNHLIMTPTMSGTRDVGFRPSASLPIRSPAATTTSLSYSTEPSNREQKRSGNGDQESSVTFASPVPIYSQSRQGPLKRQQLDPTLRFSSHTLESATTHSGTIHSETTKYHSGVEREYRKEASQRNQTASNRDADEMDAASSDGSELIMEPVIFCGIACPMWFTRLVNNPFSLYRISLCIVEYAPCFWFCCCRKRELQGSVSSDRFILARLNTISFFFTMMQLVAAAWLATVLFWITGEGATGAFSPHLWNCNGAAFAVGLIGAVIMVMCFCTVRIIKEVDLLGAIRYLWSLLWIFPVEIFFNITLFDYHRVTEVWVVHWWGSNQLLWFRSNYCLEGTAETLCVVPINGGPDYSTEDDWCQTLYNSTDCSEIRDEAQHLTSFWLSIFYTSLATWGCIFMFLMLLVINTLERIISKPIVQKSRETNVPGWLFFPTVATALVGTVFLFSQSSLLRTLKEHIWVGLLYIVTSGLFFIALLMGCCLSSYSIRSNADKRRKGTAVIIFILVLAVNASLLATLFVTSIVWSTQVELNDAQRGDIACLINNNDCTNCDASLSEERCPEWSVEDVTSILQTQLKQSASLAAIFILYAVNVMSYGINLRKHLSQYQIDYV
jgi:hypothetical protein